MYICLWVHAGSDFYKCICACVGTLCHITLCHVFAFQVYCIGRSENSKLCIYVCEWVCEVEERC